MLENHEAVLWFSMGIAVILKGFNLSKFITTFRDRKTSSRALTGTLSASSIGSGICVCRTKMVSVPVLVVKRVSVQVLVVKRVSVRVQVVKIVSIQVQVVKMLGRTGSGPFL